MRDPKYLLKVFPSRDTSNHAIRFNLYHKKARNNDRDISYIGLYNNKTVTAIGKIENIIFANLIDNELIVTSSEKTPTKEQLINIKDAIKARTDADISMNHKFFCVEKFELTDFKKATPDGIQGSKLFYLKDYLTDNEMKSTSEIAQALKFKTWE